MAAAALVLLLHCAADPETDAASFPMRSTQVAERMHGWSSLSGSRIISVPDFLLFTPVQAVVPDDYRIAGGSAVSFRCPENPADYPNCDVYVYYYECENCESLKGGLANTLEYLGFTRTRCAPKFTTGVDGGAEHAMTGWVKSVKKTDTIDIPIRDTLEYAFFGMTLSTFNRKGGLSEKCAEQGWEEFCYDVSLNNMCEWTATPGASLDDPFGGTCHIATCAGNETCTTCVRDEIPYEELPAKKVPQTETFNSTIAFFHNYMSGWGLKDGAYLFDFPSRYVRTAFTSVMPDTPRIAQDHTLKFSCPFGALATPCDVVVFLYECALCDAKKGGLDVALTHFYDFVETDCAPKFSLVNIPGTKHEMKGYVRKLAPGEQVEVMLSEGLDFAVAGLSYGNHIDCSLSVTEEYCTHAYNLGFCEWNGGQCTMSKCTKMPGPPTCSPATCAEAEPLMLS